MRPCHTAEKINMTLARIFLSYEKKKYPSPEPIKQNLGSSRGGGSSKLHLLLGLLHPPGAVSINKSPMARMLP